MRQQQLVRQVVGAQYQPTLGAGWDPVTPPRSAGPRLPGRVRLVWLRVRRQVFLLAGLTLVFFMAGLARTPRGLLAIGACWMVCGFLGTHRLRGWRQLGKAAVEYVGVGLLVFLVLTATPNHKPVHVPHLQAPMQVTDAAQQDRLEAFRRSLLELVRTAASGGTPDGPTHPVTPTTRGH